MPSPLRLEIGIAQVKMNVLVALRQLSVRGISSHLHGPEMIALSDTPIAAWRVLSPEQVGDGRHRVAEGEPTRQTAARSSAIRWA
ncbi:MAG: hypothetical protein WKF84_21925 [Pyrinomonadaceae bacterium]